jgi:hypothetical protein
MALLWLKSEGALSGAVPFRHMTRIGSPIALMAVATLKQGCTGVHVEPPPSAATYAKFCAYDGRMGRNIARATTAVQSLTTSFIVEIMEKLLS